MRLSLVVLKARQGDCLMLHYGTEGDPHLILIDGGPSNVYKPFLKPRLAAVRKALKLQQDDLLPVDALMVSHVDDDHIQGILELTQDLIALDVPPLAVSSLWHNSFDDIVDKTPAELKPEAAFGVAALSGAVEIEDVENLDACKVLASIPQGRQLRDDAERLDWSVNKPLGKKLILATSQTKPVKLGGGLKVTVAGPMQPELLALQAAHDRWLEDRKKKPGTAALAAYVDDSVPNLSSLVMLAELRRKRILFTGDARGDRILEGLELVHALQPGGKLHVDVLKVPHHGSSNNLETGFFERITADHYVFSGNGESGNPEREALGMLFDARGHDPFTIHLTYAIAEIDVERKKDWETEQRKEVARKAKAKTAAAKEKITIRPDWSDQDNGLAALVKSRLAAGQEILVVGDQPHVIDLLDPLGF